MFKKSTTAVQTLEAEINEARNAAYAAGEQATQAKSDYDAAIQIGDVLAADAALQKRDQQERLQQIHTDRATALEPRREAAERQDHGPAAIETEVCANRAIEAEQAVFEEVAQAVQALAALRPKAMRAVADAHKAINDAREAARAAHVVSPRFERPDRAVALNGVVELVPQFRSVWGAYSESLNGRG